MAKAKATPATPGPRDERRMPKKHNAPAAEVVSAATDLAASMRVVASHLHQRFVNAATARDEVLRAAKAMTEHKADALTLQLVARLEKVTGATIAELGKHAEGWPVDA